MGCFVFGGSRDRDALGCRSFCITVWYLVKTGDGARVAVRCSGGLWPNRIKALRKTLPLEKKIETLVWQIVVKTWLEGGQLSF